MRRTSGSTPAPRTLSQTSSNDWPIGRTPSISRLSSSSPVVPSETAPSASVLVPAYSGVKQTRARDGNSRREWFSLFCRLTHSRACSNGSKKRKTTSEANQNQDPAPVSLQGTGSVPCSSNTSCRFDVSHRSIFCDAAPRPKYDLQKPALTLDNISSWTCSAKTRFRIEKGSLCFS